MIKSNIVKTPKEKENKSKCPFCGRDGWQREVICPCEIQKTLRQAWED